MSENIKLNDVRNVLSNEALITEEGAWKRAIKQGLDTAKNYIDAKTGEELYYNDKQIEDLSAELDDCETLEDISNIHEFGNYHGGITFVLEEQEKKESVLTEALYDYSNAAELTPADRFRVGIYSLAIIEACIAGLKNKEWLKKSGARYSKSEDGNKIELEVTDLLKEQAFEHLGEVLGESAGSSNEYGMFLASLFMDRQLFNGKFSRLFPEARFSIIKEDKEKLLYLSSDKFTASLVYPAGKDNAISLKKFFEDFNNQGFNDNEAKVNSLKDDESKAEMLRRFANWFSMNLGHYSFKIDGTPFKFDQEKFEDAYKKDKAGEKLSNKEALFTKQLNSSVIGELQKELSDSEYHYLKKKVVALIKSKFEELIYADKYNIKFNKIISIANNKSLRIEFDFEALDKDKADEDDKHFNPYKRGKSSNVLYYIGFQLLNADFSNMNSDGELHFNGNVSGFNVSWNMTLYPVTNADADDKVNEELSDMKDDIDERLSKLVFLYGSNVPMTKLEGSDVDIVDYKKVAEDLNKGILVVSNLNSKTERLQNESVETLLEDEKKIKQIKQDLENDLIPYKKALENISGDSKGHFFNVTLSGLIKLEMNYLKGIANLDVKEDIYMDRYKASAVKDKSEDLHRIEGALFNARKDLDKEYENKKEAYDSKIRQVSELIVSLSNSIAKMQKKLIDKGTKFAGSKITPDNKALCEIWKKSLLTLFSKEDCVSSGLLPPPEKIGNNKYVFDTDLSFKDKKNSREYSYHLDLEVTKEA